MINKVTLIGNVGQTPEIKILDGGSKIARISLATTYSYKDKSGNWQQNTDWHNVIGFGGVCEVIEKIAKGEKLYIEGRISYREYTKDDQKRYVTDIIIDLLRRLNPPKSEDPRMPSQVPDGNWTEPKAKADPQQATNDFISDNMANYRNLEGAPLEF